MEDTVLDWIMIPLLVTVALTIALLWYIDWLSYGRTKHTSWNAFGACVCWAVLNITVWLGYSALYMLKIID